MIKLKKYNFLIFFIVVNFSALISCGDKLLEQKKSEFIVIEGFEEVTFVNIPECRYQNCYKIVSSEDMGVVLYELAFKAPPLDGKISSQEKEFIDDFPTEKTLLSCENTKYIWNSYMLEITHDLSSPQKELLPGETLSFIKELYLCDSKPITPISIGFGEGFDSSVSYIFAENFFATRIHITTPQSQLE